MPLILSDVSTFRPATSESEEQTLPNKHPPLWSPQLLTLAGISLMGNTYRHSAWVSWLLTDPYHSDRGAHKWPDVWERGSDWCLAGKTKADSVNKDESRAGSSVRIFYFGEAGHGISCLFWLFAQPLVFLCSRDMFFMVLVYVSSSLAGGQTSAKATSNHLLQEVQRHPVTLTGCPQTLKTV